MIRGTDQQFTIFISEDYDLTKIQRIRVFFWQEHHNGTQDITFPIIKEMSSCTIDADHHQIHVCLSPSETLAFSDNAKGYVQFKAKMNDGFVFGNTKQMFTVYSTMDEEIM